MNRWDGAVWAVEFEGGLAERGGGLLMGFPLGRGKFDICWEGGAVATMW